MREHFGVMKMSSLLIALVDTQLYMPDLSHQILCVQLLNFMVYKYALIKLIVCK